MFWGEHWAVSQKTLADGPFYCGVPLRFRIAHVVIASPVVTQEPVAPVALRGLAPITLVLNIGGAARLSHRWFKDGVAITSRKSDSGSLSCTLAQKYDVCG